MTTIELKKKIQRFSSLKKRSFIKKNNLKAPYELHKQILNFQNFKNSQIVASFISFKTEISLNILNRFLETSKKKICLPAIKNNLHYLVFREFDKKTILKKGKFGILEPDDKSKELLPDFILTPCLAFDKFGYRLGYGGGYYDRTFDRLNDLNHAFTSVAVAFDDQRVNKVVHDKHDKKIDYVLTEKALYEIK